MNDIEEQVNRAMRAYLVDSAPVHSDAVRQAMRDLLAGKFKEEPKLTVTLPVETLKHAAFCCDEYARSQAIAANQILVNHTKGNEIRKAIVEGRAP